LAIQGHPKRIKQKEGSYEIISWESFWVWR
jgi:hypothetical protein